VGHWCARAGPDYNTIGKLHLSFSASFSPLTPTGDAGNLFLPFAPHTDDRWGGEAAPMTMDQPRIAGALVISLDWDTEADLDLHVQLPSDGERA